MHNYYHKHEQMSEAGNEDWGRHLSQFEILHEKYNTNYTTRRTHFARAFKTSSNSYHFYQKLIKSKENWKNVTEEFYSRYNIDMRRSRAVRSIKELKMWLIKKENTNSEDMFRK